MSDDKENGRALPINKCVGCGQKQSVYVKITDSGEHTLNFSGCCRNPKCHLQSDPSETPSWVPASTQFVMMQDRKLSHIEKTLQI